MPWQLQDINSRCHAVNFMSTSSHQSPRTALSFNTSTSPQLKPLNFTTPSTINLPVQITSGAVSLFLEFDTSTCAGVGGIVCTMDGNTCWSIFSFRTMLCVPNTCFLDVYKTPRFGGPTRAQECGRVTFPHPGEDIGLAVRARGDVLAGPNAGGQCSHLHMPRRYSRQSGPGDG